MISLAFREYCKREIKNPSLTEGRIELRDTTLIPESITGPRLSTTYQHTRFL